MDSQIETLDPANDIDWTEQFTWVQDYGQVTLEEELETDVRIRLIDGSEQIITRERFDEKYVWSPILGRYKRRYQPVKAHCLPTSARVQLDGEMAELAPGDALLQCPNGTIRAVKRAYFFEHYLSVSHYRNAKPPVFPYADE